MLKIIEKTKIWFGISLTIIIVGLVVLGIKGLNLGIDFKGGTVVDINIGQQFNVEDIRKIADKYDPQATAQVVQATAQGVEKYQVEVRGNNLTNDQVTQMFNDIKAKYNLKDSDLLSRDSIGASVSNEAKNNAIISVLVATVLMLLYITIRFEFKSGVAAVIALVHDILTTLSVYVLFQIPVNSSFIAAMLTIVGYSINDTIVVFDRIRENRKLRKYGDYVTLANGSITQTMARSINTVVTTLITITCVYIFGVASIREFALPLILGIISGCYSSIFIASPIWVLWKKGEKLA